MPRKLIKLPLPASVLFIFLALFFGCEEDDMETIPDDFYGKVVLDNGSVIDTPVREALLILSTADSSITSDIQDTTTTGPNGNFQFLEPQLGDRILTITYAYSFRPYVAHVTLEPGHNFRLYRVPFR